MLHPVLGRAASGKTGYVRELTSEYIKNGRDVVFIVPEQYSLESEKSLLEKVGAKELLKVKILSFRLLGEQILGEYCKGMKPPVSDAARAVIMSMALEALSEKLTVFSPCTKNSDSIKKLISVTDEFVRCGIADSDLSIAAEKTDNDVLKEKAAELSLIMEMYSSLVSESFSDDRFNLSRAASIIAEKNLFRDSIVVFDKFNGYTSQEYEIFTEILKNASDVYVTVCTDTLHDSTGGTGAFAFTTNTLTKLISLAKLNNIPVAEIKTLTSDSYYQSDAIAMLESSVYEAEPQTYTDDASSVTVAAAKNSYDECDFVALYAKKLVREKGLRYRDIAVVERGSDYDKYLPFALKKYGIPVFDDTRRPLQNDVIVRYAHSALSLAAKGFDTDTLMAYLKTYIAGFSAEEISLLENYAIVWGIDRSGWKNEWTGHPDGYGNEFDERSEKQLAELNELREKVIEPINKLSYDLRDADGFSAVKALYDFLINTKADRHFADFAVKLNEVYSLECERSWDEFMNVLNMLADTIGKRHIEIARFLNLFEIMISFSDIGELPSGLDQITVGKADRIRVTDKKAVFVVGANEGIFPAEVSASFVLTDSERRILRENGLELFEEGVPNVCKERFYVYSALSIPSDYLFVSYSLGDLSGSTRASSEIVSMIDKIVPNHRKIEYSLLPPAETVESLTSAFECTASHYADKTVFSESAKKYISETAFRDKLEAVRHSAEKEIVKFSDSSISEKLFGKNMFISPSRIEDYYKCPFKYFVKFGLNAKPLHKADYDSMQHGLIVHFVLEKMLSEYGSHGLCELDAEQKKESIKRLCNEYIDTKMGGKENVSERTLYSIRRSEGIIGEILDRLINEFSSGKFETKDVEMRIEYDGEIMPYSIDIPDGGQVVLHGTVDRVDTMEDDGKTYLRIIDYKTGGKEFTLNDVMSGLNVQMLVYLMCLVENGGARYGNIVPAGILYVPAKRSSASLGRYADDSDISNARIKDGRMNGIVLNDPDVIRGMEESGGGFIINASIKKDGTVKGLTFTLEQFELLHNEIDKIASDMAQSLHKGNVEILPVIGKNYEKTCEYCDYRSVCCREDGDEARPLFEGDVWEVLEGVEDDG